MMNNEECISIGFDGVDDLVQLGPLDLDTEWTFESWLKWDTRQTSTLFWNECFAVGSNPGAGTFYLMHVLGAVGFPRRLADPYHYKTFEQLQPMNQFITVCAICLVASQAIFAFNFFYSIFYGKKVGRNPWRCNSLEWAAPSPPGHGNFDFQPIVYRGPYEYGSPEVDDDYYPQIQPPPAAET